ncbi:hypothetical protein QQ045_023137 [Rhodiola kirilowii]
MKMLGQKVKRNQNVNRKGKEQSRILISVNVGRSAGSIRLIVNEDDFVVDVIGRIMKIYAREGRLPVLGSDANDFLLFCPATASDFICLCNIVRKTFRLEVLVGDLEDVVSVS